MEAAMTAIETTGTVDENHRLRLDEDLPVSGPMRVRVIVLYPLAEGGDEDEWLRSAARNPPSRTEAYSRFVAAFRDAAEKLRTGDRTVALPEGSFPPAAALVRAAFA